MKTKFYLLIVFTFCLNHIVLSQNQSGQNFYEFMDSYYVEHPFVEPAPPLKRSGFAKGYDRDVQVWGERLYPHGNFNYAANAIYNYTTNFNSNAVGASIFASWQSLGPVGTPVPVSGSGGQGNGQMHRITFDPQYGISNQIVYGASFYGGLWRYDGTTSMWTNVNTDLQLPLASVSDVAVDYSNSNNIFISTGNGDEGVSFTYSPNWSSVNPVFTVGMYRSLDYGITWEPINNGFLANFQLGGTTRRLKINETNSNQLFVATSAGIFRSNDALAPSPTWTKLTSGLNINDKEYRGLEFKPFDPTTVYVSGQDIYKSIDGGDNWISMTGFQSGLDFSTLPNFQVNRINIAVTPAAPGNLYAYIEGTRSFSPITCGSVTIDQTQALYIFKYDGTTWTPLYSYDTPINNCSPDAFNQVSPNWMAIAVNPIDENQVFFGYTKLNGSRNINSLQWQIESPYNGGGFHADIHALVYEPNTLNPKLYCANHGGISVKDLSVVGTGGWAYKNEGLAVGIIWSYDNSNADKDIFISAHQCCGVNVQRNVSGVLQWEYIAGGDGYSAQIGNDEQNIMFYQSNSQFYRYDYNSNSHSNEMNYRPYDPLENVRVYTPKTLQIKNHPETGNMYFGWTELFERLKTIPDPSDIQNPTQLWTLQSDISKYQIISAGWQRQITEFEIAENDPNYIYIVTGGADNGTGAGWQLDPHLLRTFSGGNQGVYGSNTWHNFEDVTGNLPQTTVGNIATQVITGIAVSPTNPMKLWVTFTGYDPYIKVYFSDDGGSTWYDADPTQSLANLPVNGIVYQEGTDDRIYIATDAGVYVKDNTMTDWEKYGNIPNVRVTEVRINPCSGKLTAATFGRGIWETDLLPSGGLTSVQELNQDETWSSEKHLTKNLLIKSGNTLTITANLFMPSKGKIMIEPHARLIIDGGKISNNCNEFWQGIEVWGNKSQNQFPGSHPDYQGKLLLINGATIENARNAVSLWKPGDWQSMGGVVVCNNSFFKNNTRSVEFISYTNSHPTSGNPYRNLSGFNNTSFVIDDDYRGNNDFSTHVSLWDVNGVSFVACVFENIQSNPINYSLNKNKGIFSIDAGYRIQGTCDVTLPVGQTCPEVDLNRSVFRGFNFGVHALGSSTPYTVSVDQAQFENNVKGVEIQTINNFAITRSNFIIGENNVSGTPVYHEGLVSILSSGFRIEENNFNRFSSPTANTRGCVLRNCGQDYNEFYKNSLADLDVGELASGLNRSTTNSFDGLQFLCNIHQNNSSYDLDIDNFNSPNSFDGIRNFQGEPSTQMSAGNEFSLIGNNIDGDISNKTMWPILYYHDGGATTVPTYYTSASVFLVGVNNSNTCPSRFSDGMRYPLSEIDQNNLQSQYITNKADFISVLYNYYQLMDGGNTPELILEVQETWPSEVWDLRNELLSYSPYLSVDVLRIACEANILPHAIILEICLANPDATRNWDFIDYLQYEMISPLPQSMINLIVDSWESESLRTLMEGLIANYSANMAISHDMLISDIKLMENYSFDSLTSRLQIRNSLGDQYSLVEFYVNNNEFDVAELLLQNISENSLVSELEMNEHEIFLTYVATRKSIVDAGRNISVLNSQEISEFESIANSGSLRSSGLAQSILCFFHGNCLESSTTSNPARIRNLNYGKNETKSFQNIQSKLNLQPNPSSNSCVISWSSLSLNGPTQFRLNDIVGKSIVTIALNNHEGEYVLNTSNIENGIYTYYVVESNNLIHKGQLIIQH